MKEICTIFTALVLFASSLYAQDVPPTMHLSPADHLLITDGTASEGLFDESVIRTYELWFSQSNYWQQMTTNYSSHTDIPATLIVDGDTFPDVGVRFKGQTSYSQSGTSQKKSFNITLDYLHPDQNLQGYSTVNLNNCFQDASFMREVAYLHQIRRHVPASKASYVHLFINGESWGIYPQVQQLDGDYLKEWFFSNDGARWRADRPDGATGGGPGGGGGGGPMWGDGTAAINYLGSDTTEYQQYYTLKSSHVENPWDKLVHVCDVLNNTPLDSLEARVREVLDLDRTLWFLATEIAFSDDDSYVFKGKMDYYIYWDPETGRLTPLEVDGNSAMTTNAANWGPFYNANKVNYPLLNRLLAVPSIRQRYLAHFRTLLQDALNPASFNPLIDQYDALINAGVQADTKKLYSVNQYNTEKTTLRNFVLNHRNNLLANTEMAAIGPVISNPVLKSAAGDWGNPLAGETATVNVSASSNTAAAWLYYAPQAYGNFEKTEMFDDGQHNDGAADDGVYGAQMPGFQAGALVRFYVEAIADNTAGSRTYLPTGAEHDVFYFGIDAANSSSPVVINEIMASNSTTASDENGDFDDWIELYNTSGAAVDLSGYFLSDNPANLTKWTFPAGTSIAANGYLIVWADEEQEQGPLHCNFKLSASGEQLYLLDPQSQWVDTLNFGLQTTDLGYARVPNGTGPFVIQAPTFNATNSVSATETPENSTVILNISPNPATETVQIRMEESARGARLTVSSIDGKQMLETPASTSHTINVSEWPAGMYIARVGNTFAKLMVTR